MVSIAPLRIPFPNAPSAAGKKHKREDSPVIMPTLASMSKKRVRFASGAENHSRSTDQYESDATMTSTAPEKKPKVTGASMRSMFKMFVSNALDERALVRSFPSHLSSVCPALWDSI